MVKALIFPRRPRELINGGYISVFFLYRKATRLKQAVTQQLLLSSFKQVLPSILVLSTGLRRKD